MFITLNSRPNDYFFLQRSFFLKLVHLISISIKKLLKTWHEFTLLINSHSKCEFMSNHYLYIFKVPAVVLSVFIWQSHADCLFILMPHIQYLIILYIYFLHSSTTPTQACSPLPQEKTTSEMSTKSNPGTVWVRYGVTCADTFRCSFSRILIIVWFSLCFWFFIL